MGFMSKDEVNVSLFDEVKRLQIENSKLEERAEAAERERDELKQKQLEQLRLFTNALLRKFKSVDKISKIDINSFASRRLNQLRQQLNGDNQ